MFAFCYYITIKNVKGVDNPEPEQGSVQGREPISDLVHGSKLLLNINLSAFLPLFVLKYLSLLFASSFATNAS